MTVGVKIDFLLLIINIDNERTKDKIVESRGGVAVAELFRIRDNWVVMENGLEKPVTSGTTGLEPDSLPYMDYPPPGQVRSPSFHSPSSIWQSSTGQLKQRLKAEWQKERDQKWDNKGKERDSENMERQGRTSLFSGCWFVGNSQGPSHVWWPGSGGSRTGEERINQWPFLRKSLRNLFYYMLAILFFKGSTGDVRSNRPSFPCFIHLFWSTNFSLHPFFIGHISSSYHPWSDQEDLSEWVIVVSIS